MWEIDVARERDKSRALGEERAGKRRGSRGFSSILFEEQKANNVVNTRPEVQDLYMEKKTESWLESFLFRSTGKQKEYNSRFGKDNLERIGSVQGCSGVETMFGLLPNGKRTGVENGYRVQPISLISGDATAGLKTHKWSWNWARDITTLKQCKNRNSAESCSL